MDIKLQFHYYEIDGFTFIGHLGSDGPTLSASKSVFRLGSTPLGAVSSLRRSVNGRSGWTAYKLMKEARFHLEGLSDTSAEALSNEFGISIEDNDLIDVHFKQSNAWNALKNWCVLNRNAARAHSSSQTYLPGWYEQAVEESRSLA